jgi:hypothetical protein
MKPSELLKTVPAANQVRADLTAAQAEVRALRKLLVIAKETEQAQAARRIAATEGRRG